MGCCKSNVEQKPAVSKGRLLIKRQGSIHSFYEINDLLGEGAYGTVRRGKDHRSGLERAIKQIDKQKLPPEHEKMVRNEYEILSKLDHPNIMKIYEVIESPKSFCAITELLTGGELFELITKKGSLPEKVCSRYMRELLSGLFYCHNLKIVHGDLKLENLILENKDPNASIKIIDFGIARYCNSGDLTGRVGTVTYN
jgi:calcium-dependent protein kinase